MKTAVVIPTLNAEKEGRWQAALDSIASQQFRIERKVVIDSASSDATCAMAASSGWECWKISRGEFNHGKTRDDAVRKLAKEGIDTVVFLSQDVILASPNALEQITHYLWNNPVAGCFGRQVSRKEYSFDGWQRKKCYPSESAVKTLGDVHEYGMMTVFFSNAFSAWKTAEVIRGGGFPETEFGEDVLLAARVLNQGGAVGYCSEAVAMHEHSSAPWNLFARGMQVGKFHRRHPELLRQFNGRGPGHGISIPWILCLPLAIKALGYFCGRMGRKLIPWLLFMMMWIALLPAIVLYDVPKMDVMVRYAPMAEAFARGDWQYAFHPRVTPLLPVCAGIISFLFSCGGYLSCQIAASLFASMGIFPFYAGCRRIYGEKIAVAAGILYAFCSPFLRLGYFGLRENSSVLGLAILFYSASVMHEKSDRLYGFVVFALGAAIMLSSRGDVALFVLIASLALLVRDVLCNRIPWRSLFAGACVLVALSPLLLYNYRMIGYPVPEVRHAAVLRRLCRKMPVLKCLENQQPVMPLGNIRGKNNE